MPAHTSARKLTSRQEIAIEAITRGATHAKAAREAGVARETVSRWNKLPQFVGALSEARLARRQAAMETLDETVPDCIELLAATVRNKRQPRALRMKAATELLDRAGVIRGQRVEVEHGGVPYPAVRDLDTEELRRLVRD